MDTRSLSSLVLLSVVTFVAAAAAAADQPITTGSLIDEMVDMHRLGSFPAPAYKTVQYSSYDHRSSLPGGPEWFANSDGFGGEPIPNFEAVVRQPGSDGIGEYLICDVACPGAIVRTWTAAIEGTIRLYLDGSETPLYDGPAQEFLLQPYRRFSADVGADNDILADTFYQRNAAYCPIPFAKGCRMVWIGDLKKIHFYQVQVRQYEPSAGIVSFKPEDLKTFADRIRRAVGILADPDGKWPFASTEEPLRINATVEPGKVQEALLLKGPKAVERLELKVSANDLDRALRQTILHVQCDDYPWAQVQAPLGDFFGAAPGINPFNAVPFTVRPDGTMICRYVMPFARSLKISFDNRGRQPVTVTGSCLPAACNWSDATSMHFRARWRVDHDLIADNNPPQDLPYLLADGAGVYVGSACYMLNPNPIPTPGGNWWGEGDEKVFVDDDVRPSTFGTGSEDYYNYAWSSPDIFLVPYCGQPRNDGPANRGFVTNHRWHILDALPFKQRISFYMELFPHERTPGFSYARIGYHYARPGVIDDHLAITDADVRHLELPANWQPAARGGAHASVFHQVEDLVQGDTQVTLLEGNLWAGGKLAVWSASKGDQLNLKLPIKQARKYGLRLAARLCPGSGRAEILLDGQPAGFGGDRGNVDFNCDHRTLLRVIYGKDVELTEGDHALTLRYLDDRPGHIGLDFLWIQNR